VLSWVVIGSPSLVVSASTPAMDVAANNEAVVRTAFDRWAKEGRSVFGLLSPDVRWTIHGSGPPAGVYVGTKEFVQGAAEPLTRRLASPLVPKVHHVWSSGDTVIIRFDASATTTGGALYRNQFLWIWRMEGGAVVEAEAFLDLAAYREVVRNSRPSTRGSSPRTVIVDTVIDAPSAGHP
jgi:hypothetical protein